MWIRTTCNLEFQMADSTPLILMLRPRSGTQQWIARESYSLKPSVPVVEYTDIFGNLCQRLVAPAGYFAVSTSAEVLTAKYPAGATRRWHRFPKISVYSTTGTLGFNE